MELFAERNRGGTALILISHDLAVVEGLVDTVLVLRAGRVVERGPVSDVLSRPAHPFTNELVAAIPVTDPVSQRRRLLDMRPEIIGAEPRDGVPQ